MGWWDERRPWQVVAIAQMGGASLLGGGVFFFQFRSPGLADRPVFLMTAIGGGVGGSIGSAITIPYSEIARQLLNPRARSRIDQLIWNDAGTFALGLLNGGFGNIFNAGVSVVFIGAQFSWFRAEDAQGTRIFSVRTALGNLSDFVNLFGAQGGAGAGSFVMRGRLWHLG